MSVELGHFFLWGALALALVQSVLPFVAGRHLGRTVAVLDRVAITTCALVALSFAALVSAYMVSDFSVKNVWENSHTDKPLLFKITGTWGNHEGSMLLWVLILTLFGAGVAVAGRNIPPGLKSRAIAVQGWIVSAFVLFILFTSNPFERLVPAPPQGRDLNPILQDIGLAIHPPLLYLGYVGFSISFAFAIAALLEGRIDSAWARWIRPWTLIAWIFLTAGIAMGSYWAYYELGWGGWWFWDPVENASFMPWLAGTALLHSAVVMEKRGALKIWTLLLAILTFSLSLLGTFLVRSGVLTSVHAFATDPTRGAFILAIFALFIGGGLTLFAFRAHSLEPGGLFAPISREGALVFNNLFLTTAAATVLIGTLYPLFLEMVTGQKISVGPPYFNMTFGPVMLPLLAAIPFGPLLAWKRGDLSGAAQRLYFAFGAALLVTVVMLWVHGGKSVFIALGFGLAAWLMIGSLAEIATRIALGKGDIRLSLMRLKGLPRSVFGAALGHFGVGVMVLGIIGVTAFGTETVLEMKQGDVAGSGPYQVRFVSIEERQGPNFQEAAALFSVSAGGRTIGTLESARRFYPVRQTPTTEAGIMTRGFSQIYVSLGEARGESMAVRIWWKPMITLIWIGAIFMAAGGTVSLSDRRLRVGVPQRKRAARPARA